MHMEKKDKKKCDMTNYCYILCCGDGTFYTGWTNNLEKRLSDHQTGRGSKYTRARLPVKLVYYETFLTKEAAMSREYAIKKMTRKAKEQLIKKSEMHNPNVVFVYE